MRFIFRFRGFFLVVDLLVAAMLVSNWHLRNGDLPKCFLSMNASLSQERAPEEGALWGDTGVDDVSGQPS
jgi:hypothetical protein